MNEELKAKIIKRTIKHLQALEKGLNSLSHCPSATFFIRDKPSLERKILEALQQYPIPGDFQDTQDPEPGSYAENKLQRKNSIKKKLNILLQMNMSSLTARKLKAMHKQPEAPLVKTLHLFNLWTNAPRPPHDRPSQTSKLKLELGIELAEYLLFEDPVLKQYYSASDAGAFDIKPRTDDELSTQTDDESSTQRIVRITDISNIIRVAIELEEGLRSAKHYRHYIHSELVRQIADISPSTLEDFDNFIDTVVTLTNDIETSLDIYGRYGHTPSSGSDNNSGSFDSSGYGSTEI